MKVLYISIEFSKLHMQIVESLSNNDIEVCPFTYSLKREKTRVNYENVTYEEFPLRIFRGPIFYLFRLRYIAKKCYTHYMDKNIDYIYGHMLFCDGYICNYLSKKLNIPYAVAVRNTDMNLGFLWKKRRIKRVGLEIIKQARKIVFVNCSYKSQLLSKVPEGIKECVSKKSVLIPNGIDCFWLDNIYKKERFKNQNKKYNVLTVGRIEKNKNQLKVAEAIERLISAGYIIEYTIVGEAKDIHYLKKIERYDFVKVIHPVPKESLIHYYRKTDLFVLPSEAETFGLTYVEAISQDCPILYSENQGFDGFFSEGVVGYHVNTHSVESIMEGIKKAFSSNWRNLSVNAFDFSWDSFAKKAQAVFCESISN